MYPQNQWVQLNDFALYRQWKTPSGFLCGTYASSVLLAYYQDNLNPKILPKKIRTQYQKENQELVAGLQPLLQKIDLPTLPLQINFGLNRFFKKYHSGYRARFTSSGSWQRVTKKILQGEPVMVGVMKWLGSSYGNHWVVVHGFYEGVDGKRYYKIHDNWGNAEKIIPARWGNGTISLQKVKITSLTGKI